MNTLRIKPLRALIILAVLALIVMSGCAPLVADASATLSAAAPAQSGDDASNVRLARLELKGTVEQISSDSLVVDGQFFRIDNQSVVVSALKAGDRVQVKAVLLPDDSRYAQSVRLHLSDDDSSSFNFYGTVQSISADLWLVSSTPVSVSASTMISANIQVGSFVEVEGRIVNGNLVADKIKWEDDPKMTKTPGVDDDDENEFFGVIESISNGVYVISGRTVATNASTEIKGNLAVGMKVKVHATLQPDGTYLAREIEPALPGDDDDRKTGTPGADDDRDENEFFGVIESISNGVYVISGRTVATNASTEIKGNLAVGMKVKVHAALQPNGTYLAREIEPALPGDDDDSRQTKTPGAVNGEVEFIGTIDGIQNGVILIGGKSVQTNASTEIKGALAVGLMVKVHATLQPDGSYLAREIELTNRDDNSDKSRPDDDSDDDSNSGSSGSDDDSNSGKGGDDDDDSNSGSGGSDDDDSNSGSGGDDDDDDNSGKGGDDAGKDN